MPHLPARTRVEPSLESQWQSQERTSEPRLLGPAAYVGLGLGGALLVSAVALHLKATAAGHQPGWTMARSVASSAAVMGGAIGVTPPRRWRLFALAGFGIGVAFVALLTLA